MPMAYYGILLCVRRCGRYELRPGGANADVTASDLGEWVDEVTRVFLVDSVVTQVGALVKGKCIFTTHDSVLQLLIHKDTYVI